MKRHRLCISLRTFYRHKKFLQIHEKLHNICAFKRRKMLHHKFSGHQQTRIYSELTNFSIHHSNSSSISSHFFEIAFLSHDPSHLFHSFLSPDTAGSQASREKGSVQMWNVMQLFISSFYQQKKFVFLVKWLEASRTVSVSNLNGSWMFSLNKIHNF